MDGKDRRKPNRALSEKYFHSRGALSHEAGRFASAIRFFLKALALEDLPYTRYHLGLSYLGKGDLDRAHIHMTRAIELSPSVAEYYHGRSAVRRLKGDEAGAEEDHRAAVRLDANYGRIERIRAALAALKTSFDGVDEGSNPEERKVKDGRLRAILRERDASASARRGAVKERSCVVPCPAYCCHFVSETLLHGLCIGPWKLQAIRAFLKEEGLRDEEYLGRMPFGPEEERLRLVPPDVIVKDRGERVVFHPGRASRAMDSSLAPGLPRTTDYRELAWITPEARACAFLDRGRCVIHDLGGEPALPACKEFICLTGYVFLVLDWLGLNESHWATTGSMEEMNGLAVDVLLLLSDRLYGNDRLTRMEKELDDLFRRALDTESRAEDGLVTELIGRYLALEADRGRLFTHQKEQLKQDLHKLFEKLTKKPEGESSIPVLPRFS